MRSMKRFAAGAGLLALIYTGYQAIQPNSSENNLPQSRPATEANSTSIRAETTQQITPAISTAAIPISTPGIPSENPALSKDSTPTFDQFCAQFPTGSNVSRQEPCVWRQQLLAENRDEPWARDTEAALTTCVNTLLSNDPDLVQPDRIECRTTACLVDNTTSSDIEEFVFKWPPAACAPELFAQLLTPGETMCMRNQGKRACQRLFARRNYYSAASVSSSAVVLNPVLVTNGFEKLLKPVADGNSTQPKEIARLHAVLESENRDQIWATHMEQQIHSYVEEYLARQGADRNALTLHVVVCGQTLCEVQVSASRNSDPSLSWFAISREMMQSGLGQEFNGANNRMTTLSKDVQGFVSFYERRVPL